MRATGRSLILVLLFLPILSLFQNCSKVSFDSTELSNSVDGSGNPTCTIETVTSSKTVKMLFLMDTSGSNLSNNSKPGTDVNKVWRLKTIDSFLQVYQGKSNFQFGFAYFKEEFAASLMNSGSHGVFTKDSAKITQAITDFKAVADHGSTPYDQALLLVKDMISYDQQQNSNSKDIIYVVVMVSDGVPANCPYMNGASGLSLLESDVNSVMASARGQISMNTVYLYNSQVPTASDKVYLQKISSVGDRTFLEANSQSTLAIADTISVPHEICSQ